MILPLKMGVLMQLRRFGAGDGDRTRDVQLGKLPSNPRHTQNQAFRVGAVRRNAALSASIEHNSEHNSVNSPHHRQNPQRPRNLGSPYSEPSDEEEAKGGGS